MGRLDSGLRRLCLTDRLLEVCLADVRGGFASLSESHHFGVNLGSLNPFVSGNSGLVCGKLGVQILTECASPAWYFKGNVLDVVRVGESNCSADFLAAHIKSLLGQEVETFLRLGSCVLVNELQRLSCTLIESIKINHHLAAPSTE